MSNLYDIITEKIVKQLDNGIIPWIKPWTCSTGAVSHTNGRPYSLLNQILLMDDGDSIFDLPSREYITFNQVKAEGGNVRKGEKSKMVVFWKVYERETGEVLEDGTKEVVTVPVLRYYNVFEVSQCEGISRKYEAEIREHEPIAEAESIIEAYFGRETCRLVVKNSDRAYYSPIEDLVCVPQKSQYEEVEKYYSTLFHEMTHSTGHPSRLNRRNANEIAAFGSESYSKEELVAELGSAFLMNRAGIDCKSTFSNSVAYIQEWSKALRRETHLFVNAAAKAEAAVNYITGNEKQFQNA